MKTKKEINATVINDITGLAVYQTTIPSGTEIRNLKEIIGISRFEAKIGGGWVKFLTEEIELC